LDAVSDSFCASGSILSNGSMVRNVFASLCIISPHGVIITGKRWWRCS
jgi:hypothetical protein